MSREHCCSRGDRCDIGSCCDPMSHQSTRRRRRPLRHARRNKDNEEQRNGAGQVVPPPPSPKVRRCWLCLTMADLVSALLSRNDSDDNSDDDSDDNSDDDDAGSARRQRQRRCHPRPQPTGCAVQMTMTTTGVQACGETRRCTESSQHGRATSFNVCLTFATSGWHPDLGQPVYPHQRVWVRPDLDENLYPLCRSGFCTGAGPGRSISTHG